MAAAAPAALAVPIAMSIPTGDAWDGTGSSRGDINACQSIPPEFAFAVPADRRAAAIGALDTASVSPLDDAAAARWLDAPPAATPRQSLFDRLLRARLDALYAQRNAAYNEHKGSWSEADDMNYGALEAATGAHYPPFRPYLVRGLAAPRPQPWDAPTLQLCGDGALWVSNVTMAGDWTRAPLVVFLQAAPSRSLAVVSKPAGGQ
jgi:hypothetical protein